MKNLGEINKYKTSNQSGFTLVETVVVMVILGLFLISSIKSYDFIQDWKLQQVSQEIKYFIETGKQNSILSNMDYYIICDTTDDVDYIMSFIAAKEVDRYWIPENMEVGIGSGNETIKPEHALPNVGHIEFAGDMTPYRTGTLRLRYKGGDHLIEIVTQAITGNVTISRVY